MRHAPSIVLHRFLLSTVAKSYAKPKSIVEHHQSDLNEMVFQGPWQGRDYTLMLQWVILHVIEHDLHHGGEVSFTLGMHNLQSIDL